MNKIENNLFRCIRYAFLFGILFNFGCSKIIVDDRPNIILIAADDLGWSDLGCYGSEINTPNLDRLAENGMRFTRFYNTSKCFPSRAALLTSLYAQDNGYGRTHTGPLKNAVTIGEVLQRAEYLTYWSGKHHGLENAYNRGFDHYFGLKDGASNHFNPVTKRENEQVPANKPIVREGTSTACYTSLIHQVKRIFSRTTVLILSTRPAH